MHYKKYLQKQMGMKLHYFTTLETALFLIVMKASYQSRSGS